MPTGHQDYYGFKPGCCRVCSGCNTPWTCKEMKCHICYWYMPDEYEPKGVCTYAFKPKSATEKLRGMLAHATKHVDELPPKSLRYYRNLALDNPEWPESPLFFKEAKERLKTVEESA